MASGSILCGPRLTKQVQVWTGSSVWRPSARRIRRALKAEGTAKGLAARATRAARWRDQDTDIAVALDLVDWKKLLQAPSLTANDTEFWHKLRLHQLYTWPTATTSAECPETECADPEFRTPRHIFWACPASREVWQQVFDRWGRPEASDAELKSEVFGWQLPPSDHDWIKVVADHPDNDPADAGDLPEAMDRWRALAWIHLVTVTARSLWSRHLATIGLSDGSVTANPICVIMAQWKRRLGMLQAWAPATVPRRLDRLILRCLARCCSDPTDSIPRLRLSSHRYLLFFDGGSRVS